MYRFNGYDGRLDRMLEVTTMILESLSSAQDKIDFCIVGHSGESYVILTDR